MKGLPAGTGLEWLKQGFALFRQQPGILMMLIFTHLLIAMLLSQLPLLGPMIAYAALPSFTMAIQQSCRLIDEGQRVHPKVLMTGFRKESIRPLFKLGLVYLAILMVLGLLTFLFLDPAWLKEAQASMAAKKQPVPNQHTMLVLSGFMLALGLSTLTLSFAPGLTYWKGMPTFKAIFYSVFAVFGSKGPMAVMVLTWVALFMVIQMVIGLLFGATAVSQVILTWFSFIAILIFHCATYAAYKQILGAPEDQPAPAK
ncbi:MAG: BPSS1780 family membrane protein [Telluria sp.]